MYKVSYLMYPSAVQESAVLQCPWPVLYWLELLKLTVSKGIVELKLLCVDAQCQVTCIQHETGISVDH